MCLFVHHTLADWLLGVYDIMWSKNYEELIQIRNQETNFK